MSDGFLTHEEVQKSSEKSAGKFLKLKKFGWNLMKRKRRGIFRLLASFIKIILLVSILALVYLGYGVYQNIKRVEVFRSQVENLTKRYGIEDQDNLVLAIIYTESKGNGMDLMQSSESLSGEIGSITTQEESLDQGIQYLAQAISQAKASGCDLETAIQSYNFGLDYIGYVQQNGGENSVKLAEKYSKEVLAPMLGNTEVTSYRYWQLPAIIYNGGYLYDNGGNIVYADVVQMKESMIRIYGIFF